MRPRRSRTTSRAAPAASVAAPPRPRPSPPRWIDRPTRYGKLLDPVLRFVAFSYLCAIVAGVVVYKAAFIQMLTIDPFFAAYGLIVSGYIICRFVMRLFYRPSTPPGSSRGSRS